MAHQMPMPTTGTMEEEEEEEEGHEEQGIDLLEALDSLYT